MIQPLQRFEIAKAVPVAIRPLIIAGRVDHRGVDLIHIDALLIEDRILASRPAAPDVADMDDEVRLCGIDFANQRLKQRIGPGRRAIGHIAKRNHTQIRRSRRGDEHQRR